MPRVVVTEPSFASGVHEEVGLALQAALQELHAAGVKAELVLEPFAERQEQHERVQLPFVVLDAEAGPVGALADLGVGAHFGDATLSTSRFE